MESIITLRCVEVRLPSTAVLMTTPTRRPSLSSTTLCRGCHGSSRSKCFQSCPSTTSSVPSSYVHKNSDLLFALLIYFMQVCRVWRHIAQDTSLWRHRYVELYQQYPDLLLHKKHQTEDVHIDLARLSWQSRYCQARTQVNWRMGIVQRLQLIAQGCRLLSVKLRQHSLVTLSEVR